MALSIWLLTLNDVPQYCAWATVKLPAEVGEGDRSALNTSQLPASGWDATMTNWRNAPDVLTPAITAQVSPTFVGRIATCAGLIYDVDEGGRPSDTAGAENMVPDATIVSDEDVLAAAETMGAEFSFTEKTTLDVIRVSDDPNAVKGGETYLITRQAGVATRA